MNQNAADTSEVYTTWTQCLCDAAVNPTLVTDSFETCRSVQYCPAPCAKSRTPPLHESSVKE